jgi:hypothetical protein
MIVSIGRGAVTASQRNRVMPKRKRRTEREMIADLEEEMRRVRARIAQRKVKKDPALRHVSAALGSIEKALEASEDAATKQAMDEARSTLRAVLSLNKALPQGSGNGLVRKRRKSVEADYVLQCVARRPGIGAADIAAEVGADTKDVSPVLKSLKDEGKVRSEGQARGTRYYVDSAT